MNSNDDIARRFAELERLPVSEAFAAGVRHALVREQARARVATLAGAAIVVLMVALAVILVPFGSLYPIRLAQAFLGSFTGFAACLGCAIALTAWFRVAAD